jgi:prephenate dehydrogenase
MPLRPRRQQPTELRRVAIIGLGLIGASIGLALRKADRKYSVVGHDRSRDAADRARKRGAVDREEWNLPAAVENADLVVVATPASAVERVFQDIAPHLKAGAVVTDTASTKAEVCRSAQAHLPASVAFVGGHPMAGKEASGPDAADEALFRGCTWCLCAGDGASKTAIDTVAELVSDTGARALFVDPEEHDGEVAIISHLPFLLSVGLVKTASESPSWQDLRRLAAGGFRDVSRLASGDPDMHRDICLTNRESIVRTIRRFQADLDQIAAAVEGDPAALQRMLAEAKAARDDWYAARYGRAG